MGLGGCCGAVLVEKFLDVAVEGGGVFGGEDGGLGGEAVGDGVARGSMLTGVGDGAGGMLGVRAIGGGAVGSWGWGYHVVEPP